MLKQEVSFGEKLFEMGDMEGAREVFAKVLKADSLCAVAHNNLGVLYWQTGEVGKAADHFEKALEINPNDRSVILNCGKILTHMGNVDNAVSLYRYYLTSNPDDTEIDRLLAEITVKRTGERSVSNKEYIPDELYASTHDGIRQCNSKGIENEKQFFFVLGSPRSGTKWFSEFMTSEKTVCFHELSLICHGNLEGHLDALMKFKPVMPETGLDSQLHRLFYLYPSFGRLMYHRVYEAEQYVAAGNSDCVQVFFARALHHVFPCSRFLIILRNGFDIALSLEKMMEVNTGGAIEHMKREILETQGYQCKDFFEIACWRWYNNTKKLIENTEYLSSDRFMIVCFEKLFSDMELLRRVWDFLVDEKVPFDLKRAEKFINMKINIGTHQKPGGKTIRERWHSLDNGRRESFLKIADSFIKELPLYSGWPDIDF